MTLKLITQNSQAIWSLSRNYWTAEAHHPTSCQSETKSSTTSRSTPLKTSIFIFTYPNSRTSLSPNPKFLTLPSSVTNHPPSSTTSSMNNPKNSSMSNSRDSWKIFIAESLSLSSAKTGIKKYKKKSMPKSKEHSFNNSKKYKKSKKSKNQNSKILFNIKTIPSKEVRENQLKNRNLLWTHLLVHLLQNSPNSRKCSRSSILTKTDLNHCLLNRSMHSETNSKVCILSLLSAWTKKIFSNWLNLRRECQFNQKLYTLEIYQTFKLRKLMIY